MKIQSAFWKSSVLPLVLGCSSLLLGCQKNNSEMPIQEVQSPDKHYTASVFTIINAGFGTGYVATFVTLRQKGQSKGMEILEFSNNATYRDGITPLDMRWNSSNNLKVTYKGNPSVDFQSVKCAGVEITLEQESQSPK
jgi:hypothetical protein